MSMLYSAVRSRPLLTPFGGPERPCTSEEARSFVMSVVPYHAPYRVAVLLAARQKAKTGRSSLCALENDMEHDRCSIRIVLLALR